MTDSATDAHPLKGQKVAFTGKLASLTRAKAAALVRAHGGEWLSSVMKQTSMLVVGQEGWPLGQDGRLTRELQRARKLQRGQSLSILTEADFLARLGLEPTGPQRLSTADLSQVRGSSASGGAGPHARGQREAKRIHERQAAAPAHHGNLQEILGQEAISRDPAKNERSAPEAGDQADDQPARLDARRGSVARGDS